MVETTILEEGRKGDFYFLGGVLLSPPAPPTIEKCHESALSGNVRDPRLARAYSRIRVDFT